MANNPQARAIFASFFNGQPNIMTPERIGYRMIAAGHLAVEVSRGEGINRRPIYGVTVLNAHDPKDRAARNLSELFDSEASANAYIARLRDWRPEQVQP